MDKETKTVKKLNIPADNVSELNKALKEASGLDVNMCYQCRKCTSGCPVAYTMDYPPAQLMHAVRLGLKDLVLNSSTIWVCASCETCTTRCPQEVDIAKVMDALRAMAVRTGVKPKERDVSIFHGVGLNNLRLFGRMHELSLAGMLMLSTRNFSKDMGLGMKMIKKGKMKLLPSFKGAGTTRKIFSKVKEAEKA